MNLMSPGGGGGGGSGAEEAEAAAAATVTTATWFAETDPLLGIGLGTLTYDFNAQGQLIRARLDPNTGILALAFLAPPGTSLDLLNESVPFGVDTEVLEIRMDEGTEQAATITVKLHFTAFRLTNAADGTATLNFDIVLRAEGLGVGEGLEDESYTRFAGTMTGTVAEDGSSITWNEVEGTQSLTENPQRICDFSDDVDEAFDDDFDNDNVEDLDNENENGGEGEGEELDDCDGYSLEETSLLYGSLGTWESIPPGSEPPASENPFFDITDFDDRPFEEPPDREEPDADLPPLPYSPAPFVDGQLARWAYLDGPFEEELPFLSFDVDADGMLTVAHFDFDFQIVVEDVPIEVLAEDVSLGTAIDITETTVHDENFGDGTVVTNVYFETFNVDIADDNLVEWLFDVTIVDRHTYESHSGEYLWRYAGIMTGELFPDAGMIEWQEVDGVLTYTDGLACDENDEAGCVVVYFLESILPPESLGTWLSITVVTEEPY